MADNEKARLHAIIEGRVQGVGFRAFTQSRASSLGITGWVRNNFNGTVEVVAEGEREDLEKLLKALRRGPRTANVTNVKSEWKEARDEFGSFRVRMSSG